MDTEDFVTYEQAIALNNLGFNYEVNHYYYKDEGFLVESIAGYNNEDSFNSQETSYDDFNYGYCDEVSCSAPTLAQAQKWLNKIKDLKLFIIPSPSDRVPYSYTVFNTAKTIYKNPPRYYSSYEESLSAGITKCIELLEKED